LTVLRNVGLGLLATVGGLVVAFKLSYLLLDRALAYAYRRRRGSTENDTVPVT
jgi:hypothetical protein